MLEGTKDALKAKSGLASLNPDLWARLLGSKLWLDMEAYMLAPVSAMRGHDSLGPLLPSTMERRQLPALSSYLGWCLRKAKVGAAGSLALGPGLWVHGMHETRWCMA